jgi:demethylmenaquinone methyltransferase/2-methoxy-6-polyprenyl-1,4-benzoquinol methylase
MTQPEIPEPLRPIEPGVGGELVLRKDGRTISRMFDAVAPRYDLLNQVLSLGIDGSWRRALAAELDGVTGAVLDLCTGTGDVARTISHRRPDLAVVGLDFAPAMVRRGRAKVDADARSRRVWFGVGDATRLAVGDAAVDGVTIAFGIRNVEDTNRALRECWRVLRPGGRLVVLEFSLPPNPVVRAGYLGYFRHVLPRVGQWLSGVGSAYRYLPASVLSFPEGEAFLDLLAGAGFEERRLRRLTLGIASLYVGVRPRG